jgi:hypothetical protein
MPVDVQNLLASLLACLTKLWACCKQEPLLLDLSHKRGAQLTGCARGEYGHNRTV